MASLYSVLRKQGTAHPFTLSAQRLKSVCLQTKLFASSEVPIFQVFSDNNVASGEISDHMRSVMDDLVRPYVFWPFSGPFASIHSLANAVGSLRVLYTGSSSGRRWRLLHVQRRGGNICICALLLSSCANGSREWAETAGTQ